MQLLELDNGSVSLEFSPAERTQIMRRLSGLGALTRTTAASHEVLTVNGAEIIYTDDWDEPCLMASSQEAVILLRRIAADTHRSQAA